jgi:hypothetical protein
VIGEIGGDAEGRAADHIGNGSGRSSATSRITAPEATMGRGRSCRVRRVPRRRQKEALGPPASRSARRRRSRRPGRDPGRTSSLFRGEKSRTLGSRDFLRLLASCCLTN